MAHDHGRVTLSMFPALVGRSSRSVSMDRPSLCGEGATSLLFWRRSPPWPPLSLVTDSSASLLLLPRETALPLPPPFLPLFGCRASAKYAFRLAFLWYGYRSPL